ncbi:unnamed protein product [Sphagnum compactum]
MEDDSSGGGGDGRELVGDDHNHHHHHHHHLQQHHDNIGTSGSHELQQQQQQPNHQDSEFEEEHVLGKIESPHKGPGREPATEWSEAATSVLITAFREKFHALDRSNFRSKDWAEVSKIVNAQCVNEKSPKTQEQCRMKVDSLKKRYRQEKDKLAGNIPCKWPWFDVLDDLIGGSPKQSQIGSARKQARFLCSPPPARPPSVVHTPYFGALSPSVYLKKKLTRVVSLQDGLDQDLMAGSLEDNIEALLHNFLEEETARDFAKKLASSKYTVATLLEMSDRELDEIMTEEFIDAARGERRGFKAAIWSRKRKLAQESEEDMELANTSGSMLEISDNFAKKEKKSGSFVR